MVQNGCALSSSRENDQVSIVGNPSDYHFVEREHTSKLRLGSGEHHYEEPAWPVDGASGEMFTSPSASPYRLGEFILYILTLSLEDGYC